MDNEKIMQMLLELLQKTAVIESKLNMLEELKLNEKDMINRIDKLENQNAEHDRVIKSLENRANIMEQFVRNNMNDSRKQMSGVFVSMALAVFSAIISIIIGLMF